MLPEWPESLARVSVELGELREATNTDRAIGLFDGSPPPGQPGAVKQGALEIMTVRRLAFELGGIQEHLAEIQARFLSDLGERFLPRTVETQGGGLADVVDSIVEWSQTAPPDGLLWVIARMFSGRTTVIRGFVVLGRYSTDQETAKIERERLRLENSFYAGFTVLTYDDLVDRARSLLDFLLRHRNGSADTSAR